MKESERYPGEGRYGKRGVYGKKKRKKNENIIIAVLMAAIVLTIILLILAIKSIDDGSEPTPQKNADDNSKEHLLHSSVTGTPIPSPTEEPELSPSEKIAQYAASNNISVDEYPERLVDLLIKNPETEDFVLGYPLNKEKRFTGKLTEYENCTSIPLLMQWDMRWGYTPYGSDVMGLTGCGPTSLSMVAIYLLKDTSLTPPYIANFAVENGYSVTGSGTSWTLMSEGAPKLGLKCEELTLDKNKVLAALDEGKPVIFIMGPGDFTDNGHYIVVTGSVDGKLKINDPNSAANSEKLWEFDDIKSQIKNLWAFSV